MGENEYRVVDKDGQTVDEGLDVAWVIYDSFDKAQETAERIADDDPEGAPYAIQARTVEPWRTLRTVETA